MKELLDFIAEFDRSMARKMDVIAVGGTALTLLGKKASTKDIDFCFISRNDRERFINAAEKIGYENKTNKLIGRGIEVDVYAEGYIFCVQLPEDYAKRAVKIKEMQKLTVYTLNPLDLVITKAARFSDRDREDINTILDGYEIDQSEFVERWIGTMRNSMVKDAKENLKLMLLLFEKRGRLDKKAAEEAEGWLNE